MLSEGAPVHVTRGEWADTFGYVDATPGDEATTGFEIPDGWIQVRMPIARTDYGLRTVYELFRASHVTLYHTPF